MPRSSSAPNPAPAAKAGGSGGALYARPARRPLITPSILSPGVFVSLAEEAGHALKSGADGLHLDVMDGHFVPNLTMGPDVCRALRRSLPDAFLDVHLMVTDPTMFVEPFHQAGADHITFHCEAVAPEHARWLVGWIRGKGMTAGIAVNPPTALERIAPLAGVPDLLLVMSVNPGFSGQSFIAQTLEKTRALRRANPGAHVQMDGGITPGNAASVRSAGCDVIVASTAVFGVPKADRGAAITALRGT